MKKKCTKCKVPKVLDDFYPSNRTIDKKASWCKKCTREKAMETFKDRSESWQNMFIG